jgi:broad specificity phosphatase PhoE
MLSSYNNIAEKSRKSSFIFLRHGRTAWNRDMLADGPSDLPLTDEGVEDVLQAIEDLKEANNITRIVTTPLTRVIQTSEMVSNAFGGIPIEVWPEFRERHFGDWSLCRDKVNYIISLAPDGPEFFRHVAEEIEKILPEDAETRLEFQDRISKAFFKMTDQDQKRGEGVTLLVAHGGIQGIINKNLGVSYSEIPEPRRHYAQPMAYDKGGFIWDVTLVKPELSLSISRLK